MTSEHVKEIRRRVAGAQLELRELEDEGAKEFVLESVRAQVARMQDELADAEDEELRQLENQRYEEAYYSPLGKAATAAFNQQQYDYATTEDYPTIVEVMQKVLDELGYELVKKNDAS